MDVYVAEARAGAGTADSVTREMNEGRWETDELDNSQLLRVICYKVLRQRGRLPR